MALDLTQGKPPPSPQDHYMIFIDTTHCRLALDKDTDTDVIVVAAVACTMVALIAFRIGKCYQGSNYSIRGEGTARCRPLGARACAA